MYRLSASSHAILRSFALYGFDTVIGSGDSVGGGGGIGARNGDVGGSGDPAVWPEAARFFAMDRRGWESTAVALFTTSSAHRLTVLLAVSFGIYSRAESTYYIHFISYLSLA